MMKKNVILLTAALMLVCALFAVPAFVFGHSVDMAPPKGVAVDVVSLCGEEVPPEFFVTDIQDRTAVTVEYETLPNFQRVGEQKVNLVLVDEGENRTVLSACLQVVAGSTVVRVEAGSSAAQIKPELFLPEGPAVILTPLDTLDLDTPGQSYPVTLQALNRKISCEVQVVDTTPPTATPQDLEAWVGDDIQAMDFLTDVVDYAPVEARFATRPNFSQEGRVEVYITLADAFGNETQYTAAAVLQVDTEPPRITGAANKMVLLGTRANYRAGVQVTDNRDAEVELKIDASAVNTQVAGRYPVVYSATDAAGNTTSVTVQVTVMEVGEDAVNARLDEVLDTILADGMSQQEQAQAIYRWVVANIRYVGWADTSGVLQGAYTALTYRRGDCYSFYAVSEALLTRAGVENMGVRRIEGVTNHYWNIIKIDGDWYHFDTCPTPTGTGFSTFMFTESQAQAYTNAMGPWWSYYNYDTSLYPEVVWE